MGLYRLDGNPPLEVNLRQSARARRLTLRVSRLDGKVTLTLPNAVPQRDGIAFLQEKEGWLRRNLEGLRPAVRVGVGTMLPVRGREVAIVAGQGPRAQITRTTISVSERRPAAPQVKAILRQMARDDLAVASDRYAAQLGRNYTKLTLRDTRSRWGSCTQDGALMYSWRLIMAPAAVLDYVAAHEVAHLVEMNHHAAFWDVVAQICPDYAQHRKWLRDNGDQLHRYIFTD